MLNTSHTQLEPSVAVSPRALLPSVQPLTCHPPVSAHDDNPPVTAALPPVQLLFESGVHTTTALPQVGMARRLDSSRAKLELRQSVPFSRNVATIMPPAVDTIPLFIDGGGVSHFFAGNKHAPLFITVTLLDPSLRFHVDESSPVVVAVWDDTGPHHAAPSLDVFKVSDVAWTDTKTVCVRLTLKRHAASRLEQLFRFQVVVRAGTAVIGVQSTHMKVMSKPSRVLVTGHASFRCAADLVARWPALGQLSTGVISNDTQPVSIAVIPPVGAKGSVADACGSDAERMKTSVLAVQYRHQPASPGDDRAVFVLDFETSARCGRFVKDNAAASQAQGIELILTRRRVLSVDNPSIVRPAVCIWDPSVTPRPTFQRLSHFWNLAVDEQPREPEDVGLQSLVVAVCRGQPPALNAAGKFVTLVQETIHPLQTDGRKARRQSYLAQRLSSTVGSVQTASRERVKAPVVDVQLEVAVASPTPAAGVPCPSGAPVLPPAMPMAMWGMPPPVAAMQWGFPYPVMMPPYCWGMPMYPAPAFSTPPPAPTVHPETTDLDNLAHAASQEKTITLKRKHPDDTESESGSELD